MTLKSLAACAAGVLLAQTPALAADKPILEPPGSWVSPANLPAAPATSASGLQLLLDDVQIRFRREGTDVYEERAVKVLDSVGLSQVGTFSYPWEPGVSTLTIHKARILRGAKVIDLIDPPERITVIRRETNLEMSMLDGALTSVIPAEGLQAGDILDFAFTLTYADPILRGHAEAFSDAPQGLPADRYRLRATWSSQIPMRFTAPAAFGKVAVETKAGENQIVVEKSNFEAPEPPSGAPTRFQYPGLVSFTDFQSWRDVAALMTPVYDKAAVLANDSALRAEVAKIAAASPDPKVRAALALHLVQQKVRYLYLQLGTGGYTPADADVTWARRFGDCKGKSALLVALLRALGIDAAPVLVSTTSGDRLPGSLPTLGVFDHVIVRAQIAGRTYWLDGTRLGDRDIDDILPPGYQWALPLSGAGSSLVAIDQPPLARPPLEVDERIDLSAGADAPVPTQVTFVYRDDLAMVTHQGYASIPADDFEKKLKATFASAYPSITPQKIETKWDEANRVFTTTVEGSRTISWTTYAAGRQFVLPGSQLGGEVSLDRPDGQDKDAPFALDYPMSTATRLSIVLPNGGHGYTLEGGGDVDRDIGGMVYHRRSRITAGVATLESSVRTVRREIPASEAASVRDALNGLAEQPVWLEAPLAGSTEATGSRPKPHTLTLAEPTDAVGFGRRGLQHLLEEEYAEAVADLTRSIELDPKAAKTFYNRGVAYAGLQQSARARSDFDAALRLDPKSWKALAGRGRMRLVLGDRAGAAADFEAAASLAPDTPDPLREAARAMDQAGRPEEALAHYNLAIQRFPSHPNRAELLNERCWLRARLGRDLTKALADCQAALALAPGYAEFLDSRALVELRLGRLDEALNDYDAVLAEKPALADSLFGRGLTRIRRGDRTGADADFAAASGLDPKIAKQFDGWGLKP
ncbi:MAG TPA: DUF3857 domain-containing protein [Caulobacteraceae bacterium]|jgi:tetratricopeptide (TPR) repeat protein/transglutaminase-like putative cysteine protease